MTSETRTRSGRPLADLTIDALRAGALAGDDFCISREQLEAQAAAAQAANHRQLAANLRRAAELTGLSNERVLGIYDLLRPGRASYGELTRLACQLASQDMPRLAAFVGEAAEAYRARGIARAGE
jgi:propanediol dehydratase small subunit